MTLVVNLQGIRSYISLYFTDSFYLLRYNDNGGWLVGWLVCGLVGWWLVSGLIGWPVGWLGTRQLSSLEFEWLFNATLTDLMAREAR